MLVPECAEVEAEPEAELEVELVVGFPVIEGVVIVAFVFTDGVNEVWVALATEVLIVVFVNTVAVIVPVVDIIVSVVSEVEMAAVDEGVETGTVSWLMVGASKADGTITPAGSQ